MDKYDKQIEELTEIYKTKGVAEFNKAVRRDWDLGKGLFEFAIRGNSRNISAGCLTMIRNNIMYTAQTEELTNRIRNDERIPYGSDSILLPSTLLVFAEYQRELDERFE